MSSQKQPPVCTKGTCEMPVTKSCTKNTDGSCTMKKMCKIQTPEGEMDCECICKCQKGEGSKCGDCKCNCECTIETAKKIVTADGVKYQCECECKC